MSTAVATRPRRSPPPFDPAPSAREQTRQQFVRVCACGCGQPTLLATDNRASRGVAKGEPYTYLRGHNDRGPRDPQAPRLKRDGTPCKKKGCPPKPEADRFFDKVDAFGDCWEWLGGHSKGYGTFHPYHGKTVGAHRFAYEYLVGPIPDGLELDHLCRNTRCVNPDHLQPVTTQINVLRGYGPSAKASRATHCPKGHPYDAANTSYRHNGKRLCKACARAWARIVRDRAKVAA